MVEKWSGPENGADFAKSAIGKKHSREASSDVPALLDSEVADALEGDKADSSMGDLDEAEFPNPWGETPLVSPDASSQTKALVAIVQSGNDLSKLSAIGNVPSFDAGRYRSDSLYRTNYLETPVGARVFAPSQPGVDVLHIARSSPRRVRLVQGEAVRLRVKSVPRMPVTFTSFDLGRFRESKLTTVTVEADEDGFAVATFDSPPGTAGDVGVIAASPVATGQIRFLVTVVLPSDAINRTGR